MTNPQPPADEPDRSERQERVAAGIVAVLLGLAAILIAVFVGLLFGWLAAVISLVLVAVVIVLVGLDVVG